MKSLRKPLIIVTLVLIWIYISWRLFYTLPTGIALIPGLLLLGSEMILAIQNTLFYILLYKPNERVTPSPQKMYSIDLFITTYNESTDLVRRTILACKNLDYPIEALSIWLCDDGRRQQMEQLAETLNVGYITRNNNDHAKAGNLNNALAHTKGELIVTIDADMIPKPNFLKNTLGYFNDKLVAFVQLPQAFYNDDIYQFNLLQSKNIPNEQDLFMRLIQTGRDRFNSTIYIGSNTIFRRGALDAIGGFATGTITEDMATGMLIQSKGYKTVFHNEVLAQGLAAESLSDFLSQRIRWARGTIQTMRKWNPITLPGLSIMQRVLYISSLFYWYFGVFRMIFLFAPILFLIFGISSLHASLLGILTFWLPYFLLTSVVERVTLDKRMKRFWSNIYETSVAPFLAWSVLVETFTKKNIPFNVTPKGVTLSKARINVPFIIPHLIFLGLSIVALIMGISNFIKGYHDGIIINLFWLIYNLIILMPTILLARERPKFRQAERFDRDYPVEIKAESIIGSITAKTINISESGCSLYIPDLQTVPEEIQINIKGKYSNHCIDGLLVYYDSFKDGYQLGIKFKDLESETFQQWVKELFGEVPNESLFQYQSKTGMLTIFKKFYKELQLPYQKKVRTSPRLEMDIDCLVFGLSNETIVSMEQTGAAVEEFVSNIEIIKDSFEKSNAILSDVGINGCKLVMEVTDFEIGNAIGIHLPNMGQLIKGNIVRSRPLDKKVELGIKWINQKQGTIMLNYINKKAIS